MNLLRKIAKKCIRQIDVYLEILEETKIFNDIERDLGRKKPKYSSIKEFFSREIVPLQAVGKIPTTELVNKIYSFCELYSGVTMFPYQEQFSKRLIRSVLDNDGDEITALFSRQSGKSETTATTVGGMMILLPQLANMPMFADDKRLQMFKNGLWVGKDCLI